MNDGEWDDILGSGGLFRKVLVQGEGERPAMGQLATVHMKGWLQEGGTVFVDTRTENSPKTFRVGEENVVPGVDMVLRTMSPGEKCGVRMTSRFGYEEQGLPPLVPPGASLEYEVELVSVGAAPKLPELMTPVERVERGTEYIEKGNVLFAKGDQDSLNNAANQYREALKYLEVGVEEENEGPHAHSHSHAHGGHDHGGSCDPAVVAGRVRANTNLANTLLQLGQPRTAQFAAKKAATLAPDNSKALYFLGRASAGLQDFDGAEEAFRRALELEPSSKPVARELRALAALRERWQREERKMFTGMFPKGQTSAAPGNAAPNPVEPGGEEVEEKKEEENDHARSGDPKRASSESRVEELPSDAESGDEGASRDVSTGDRKQPASSVSKRERKAAAARDRAGADAGAELMEAAAATPENFPPRSLIDAERRVLKDWRFWKRWGPWRSMFFETFLIVVINIVAYIVWVGWLRDTIPAEA